MKTLALRKPLAVFMSFVLAVSMSLPTAALAAQSEVTLDNHSAVYGATVVSGLSINGVDAPAPGSPLDDTATVTASEGESWDIPVLWIADDGQLAIEAREGMAYLPALAFFVPQGYALEGGAFTVTLSDPLTKLFGGAEIVSVYDDATGITNILPASLRSFFGGAASAANEQAGAAAGSEATEWFGPGAEGDLAASPADDEPALGADLDRSSLVDVYCSNTARKAFSDEDLEYLVDLIVNKLEPQAVNLIIEKFPALGAAAAEGAIGKSIGLYVYYAKGDKDGMSEHEGAEEALAYVAGDALDRDGAPAYYYILGVDLSSLAENGVRNKQGKRVRVLSGVPVETINNTIVHEMFHAFQDDYNRTGMLGAKNSADMVTPDGKFVSPAQKTLYNTVRFPHWFIEGSASAVENTYQFRYINFQGLRQKDRTNEERYVKVNKAILLDNYQHATKKDGTSYYFDLGFAKGTDANGKKVDSTMSRYVTGYLAILYLGELAARSTTGSAVSVKGGKTAISSEKIRMGLNYIYEQMHKGKTLDQVINDISPKGANGKKLYKSTSDFEKKFIKGTKGGKEYKGDNASLTFVTRFLNYMKDVEAKPGRKNKPNGSILFDFERDFAMPLDMSKSAKSDYLRIVTSNKLVKSTVPDSVACAGGGKSDPPSAGALAPAAAKGAKASGAGNVAASKPSAVTAPEASVTAASKAGVAKNAVAAPARALGTASTGEAEDVSETAKVADGTVATPAEADGFAGSKASASAEVPAVAAEMEGPTGSDTPTSAAGAKGFASSEAPAEAEVSTGSEAPVSAATPTEFTATDEPGISGGECATPELGDATGAESSEAENAQTDVSNAETPDVISESPQVTEGDSVEADAAGSVPEDGLPVSDAAASEEAAQG